MAAFHILSLYSGFISEFSKTGVIGRAVSAGKIKINPIDIRSFSKDKNRRVDDYPFGGGAGMVMACQPVADAVRSVKEGSDAPVVFFSPRGEQFTSEMAKEFSKESELILLCGHFEGIDERAIKLLVDREVSMGDYVMTGGHLAACCFVDAVSRFVPGVLGNEESSQSESFENSLLEYPQYTRPSSFEGLDAPYELLTGDHSLIHDWRLEKAIELTRAKRPDLYESYLSLARAKWQKQNQIAAQAKADRSQR